MNVMPYEERYLNHLEIFNEASIFIVSLHLFTFTPYVGDPEL
jgi:hypothetical protein